MASVDDSSRGFHVADYVLFVATLCISLAVGIYYSCTGNRQRTTNEYFLGSRQLRAIPVAFSIFMSYISAVLILGNTAEMYTAGAQYWLASIGSCIAFIVSAFVYVPFFYKLNLTSSFEYFEARFQSKLVKVWACVMFLISSIVYMGLVMFTPATALQAATGLPVWVSILVSGGLATVYTSLGGMKAVVWTDVIQGLILLGGLIVVLASGAASVGGISNVWRISEEGGRLNLFNFDFDPTVRLTFWSIIFGRFFISLLTVGTGQTSIQRYSSVCSLREAQISCLLNVPAILLVYTLTCLVGLTVFAYYDDKGCDPLANDEISSSNQLLPYYIMEVINYPGVPGTFLAAMFSGALSSLSSSLNSMSACIWTDILQIKFSHISEFQKSLVVKLLVVIFGFIAIIMAFMAEFLGGNVLQATNSIVGGIGGPSLGMFLLGTLFPWANWQGAFFGSLIGFAMTSWVSFGAYLNKTNFEMLNTTVANCTSDVMTSLPPDMTSSAYFFTTDFYNLTTAAIPEDGGDEVFGLYRMSYMYNSMFGCIITVITGLIISLITGATKPSSLESRYVVSLADALCCCCPGNCRRGCWCGVDHDAMDAGQDEKSDGLDNDGFDAKEQPLSTHSYEGHLADEEKSHVLLHYRKYGEPADGVVKNANNSSNKGPPNDSWM